MCVKLLFLDSLEFIVLQSNISPYNIQVTKFNGTAFIGKYIVDFWFKIEISEMMDFLIQTLNETY